MQIPKIFTTVTPLSKLLAILLFVSLPFLGYYFGNKYIPQTNVPINTTIIEKKSESWLKPISTDIVVPILKNNILHTYSLTTKKLESTDYSTSWGSGESGYGGDEPLLSPDGKYIAFINRQDGSKLYILPAGSTKAISLTNYPVQYLNSWSSDSSKILYNSVSDDLVVRKMSEGMGENPIWETIEKFNKNLFPGFHSFNINNGHDTYLYPVLSAEKFIDHNRIIVELKQGINNNTRYVLFNVDTFEADYSTVNYSIKSFGRQMSFGLDGKLWARVVDDGNTDTGVKIIVANFPNETGDIAETARWAFIQKPLLDPTGKYLAYTKKGEQLAQGKFSGQYPDTTVIWDSLSKKNIKVLPGYPLYWVNENIILIGKTEYGNNLQNFESFDLYNISQDKIESIFIR